MDNLRDKAYQDYLAGLSCADISKKYDIKHSTVRQWASRHWKKKELEPPTEKEPAPVKKKRDGTKNLIPVTERSKEEAREMARRGGIKSGIVRREKSTARKAAQILLSAQVPQLPGREGTAFKETLESMGLPGTELNAQMALLAGQCLSAMKGNSQAAQLILSLAGEINSSEIDVVDNDISRANERRYIAASLDFWEYCKLKLPSLYTDDLGYLREMAKALQEFEYDDNELLVINLPPRHQKTLTAKMFAEWCLGRNPKRKIIVGSYSKEYAYRLSKAVRNGISEIKTSPDIGVFSDVFPDIKIKRGSAQAGVWQLEKSPVENYLATSPESGVTGSGCNLCILDDMIRSSYEAHHAGILEAIFTWFKETMYSRLESPHKVLLVMTRWATKDLAGCLITLYNETGRKIKVITKKAYDGNKMLNERVLTYKAYKNVIDTVGEYIVKANYDQEPIDIKGRLYNEFATYTEAPKFKEINAMCDIADKGKDYLAMGIYGVTHGSDPKAYILDVLYTKDNMDVAERTLVQMLIDNDVTIFRCEENFGGRAWAKHLSELYKKMGGHRCVFDTFNQDKNKEAKILACATRVNIKIIMPEYWGRLWPTFFTHVTEYQRQGKNAHDDSVDMLSEIVLNLDKKSGFVTF